MFQFAGHLTSHSATSVIPVSMNHTVKALSPITTVLIYRGVFNKKYKLITYLTLSPLMVGIMLTCYKGQNAHPGLGYYKGIAYSLVSMMIFVTQNIFAKSRLTVDSAEVLPANASRPERKLDKLSILYFCSLTGFVFTLPVYLISEYTNPRLSLLDMNAFTAMLVAVNGVSHYVQSLLAFQILGLISPINYSIANISKRIIIILVAFVIEGKRLNVVQVLGVMLTCTGLFAYDQYGSR
ncbi:TPT-domain-containing protein [Yamadazyma tenuis ATCC 10573]|nr:TPT-domain-containing protein [Yamadazyma tenuis ATCC 10573]EGV63000.1 TPT-domain-containing protein [Yamadazyma tenuis ATCC 10573]